MRVKIKLRKEQIYKGILLFYVCSVFFSNGLCFLTWDSYNQPILAAMISAMSYASVFLLTFIAFFESHGRFAVNQKILMPLLIGASIILYMRFVGAKYTSLPQLSDLRLLLCVSVLLVLKDKYKQIAFEYMLKVFAIFVLPSLIYYLLEIVGISLPNSVLRSDHAGKVSAGMYYSHYPFGLILRNPFGLDRLCGIFDEAGFVGTISALLFAGGYGRVKKGWLFLLFIEGIMSFSLAFYLLIVVFVIARSFIKGAIRFASVMLVLLIALVLFVNIDFQNEYIASIQDRLDFSSAFLFEDNRTSSTFDEEYAAFWRKGGYPMYMGYGTGAYNENPRMYGSYSFKCLFYDYGLVGALLYFSFFVSAAFAFRLTFRKIPFLVVFLASIYQRPYVFTMQYLTLFLTAIVYLRLPERAKPVQKKGKKQRAQRKAKRWTTIAPSRRYAS